MKRSATIFGITQTLKTVGARQAMRLVLSKIKRTSDHDFNRLKAVVVSVKPGQWSDGTLGQVLPSSDGFDDDYPKTVCISERQTLEELIATLAHEFGHVCSTWMERERRCCPDSEWASELTADRYAYKWGFGRLIAKLRKGREWLHHCVGPGQWFELSGDRYQVSRRFKVRLIGAPKNLRRK